MKKFVLFTALVTLIVGNTFAIDDSDNEYTFADYEADCLMYPWWMKMIQNGNLEYADFECYKKVCEEGTCRPQAYVVVEEN